MVENEIQIDPKVTEADTKFLKMSPAQRKQHLATQGHAFPTDEQCTDEAMIAWFKDHGPVGLLRLSLARGENR